MTVNASGSRHSLALVPEVTYAVTPATPALLPVRIKSTTLALAIASLKSAEIRADRQIVGFRHGTRVGSGDVVTEITYGGAFDTLLSMALMGAWTPAFTTGSQSLSAAVGNFDRAAGSFVTDGFQVNDVVDVSGFAIAGNNGQFQVTAVAALTLTVTALQGQVMAADAAAAGRTISTNKATLKVGTQRPSVTMERDFADIGQYIRYRGVEVSKLALKVVPGAVVDATFTVTANDSDAMATTAIVGATYAAPTTTQPMNGLEGSVKEGGAVIALISEVGFSLNNNIKENYVVGQANGIQPSVSMSDVTGTATLFFADSSMYNKFVNETPSSLEFTLKDLAANSYDFLLPNVKYNAAPIPVQNDGPITIQFTFQALFDATTATNLQITRAP